MNKFRFTIKVLAIAIFMFAFASMAQAQATRTWVSGVGDDANPCSRTAPCKTFAGAISKTAKDGEIDALDPAGFGAVTITKSITIDGSATGVAGLLNALVNGVIINITDVNDVRKSVTLRAISINGAGSGLRGVDILAATKVFVENCFIAGNSGSPGDGIGDSRTTGGFLEVTNTNIENNGGNGISVNPSSGSTQINVHISNCRLQGNGARGLFVGSNVKVTVFDTTISQNATGGVFAQNTAGGSTEVAVDHCVVSNTNIGFIANTASSTIRVSNTTAMNNGGGLATIAAGGVVSSYGNNQTAGIGFPSAPTGQQ
jgi:hypothetical protein